MNILNNFIIKFNLHVLKIICGMPGLVFIDFDEQRLQEHMLSIKNTE
jgi:hypothetical protein